MRVVKEFEGLDCWLSSHLSLPPAKYLPVMIAALAAGVDLLGVSASGWTQPVYEINHKAGRVDWIKENLAALAEERRRGTLRTNIWVRYLAWPYNEHEFAEWERFAREHRIGIYRVDAWGDPSQPLPADGIKYGQELQACIDAAGPSPDLTAPPDKVCELVMDRAAIDAKGDAYLCCAFPNLPELRIGPYMEIGEHKLLLRRHNHPFCRVCQIPSRDATAEDRDRFRRAIEAVQATTPAVPS